MALPSFTVTGNIAQIWGDSSAGVLDETYPTTYRLRFTTNLNPQTDFIRYGTQIYTLETVYGCIESDGDIKRATMTTGNVLVPTTDSIVLVAANGLEGVSDVQYRVALEKPSGNQWIEVAAFWFDAAATGGGTISLADEVPVVGTDRYRGPAASIVSGYFDGGDDLVLVNRDGSYTTPIELPDDTIAFVDNGDGTVQVG